jgi:hypothetical protein
MSRIRALSELCMNMPLRRVIASEQRRNCTERKAREIGQMRLVAEEYFAMYV